MQTNAAASTPPPTETAKTTPAAPKSSDKSPETPVVNLTNAAASTPPPTETVPEDKTFTHSMDKSESVTVKGKDLGSTVVIEKYLKTGQTTRVAEKMTGAVVAVHVDEYENYLASLKKLGNIETKVLHKPE